MQVNLINIDERTFEYGVPVANIDQIARGPFFIKQPVAVVFDLTRRNLINQVTLSCLAGGYPAPEYRWYKEDFENDKLVSRRIDPLQSSRHTVSGGLLIIDNPEELRDRYVLIYLIILFEKDFRGITVCNSEVCSGFKLNSNCLVNVQ